MDSPTPLLSARLHRPPPPPRALSRPRLLARLDAAFAAGQSLLLVHAPAGFGKTTLVSAWLEARSERQSEPAPVSLHPPAPRFPAGSSFRLHPSFWLSLSPALQHPPLLVAHLTAALAPSLPPAAAQAVNALAQAQPPAPAQATLTALLNALAEAPGPLVLVLDDTHTLTGEPVRAALEFFLEHLPPAVHVVLIGRSAPPLPLARWRARGRLAELTAEDLRFTSAEAADFLAQSVGLALPPAASATLAARTEGWVAGLQLAALSLQARPPETWAASIETFSGADRFIFDYLAAEVLAHLPPERRQFLLETALFETLTGPLCAAVTGRAEAAAWLAELADAGLFTLPLDHARQAYRYHHLFRDFLRAQVAQTPAVGVPALHRRAAAWLAGQGRVPEAIEHALAAADWPTAAALITQIGDRLWTPADMAALVRWIEPLPADVRRLHPRVLLFHAWALLMTGDLPRAEACLEEVAAVLQAPPADAIITADLPGIALTIQAAARMRRDRAAAVALYERAAATLPETVLNWRGAIYLGTGFAHLGLGRYSAAAAAFTTAATVNQSVGNSYAAVYSTYYLGQLQLLLGALRQAQRTFEHALTLAAPGPTALLSAWAHLGLAEVWRERNDPEAAARYALEALRVGRLRDNAETLATGYFTLARLEVAQGRSAEALVLLQQAEPLLQHANAPALSLWVRVWRGRVWLAQGQPALLENWLGPLLADPTPPAPPRLPEYALLVRWLLACGQAAEALAWLDRLLASEPADHRGPRLELRVLQARALQAVHGPAAALPALELALAQAAPEGYRRLFLDEGPDLLALLRLYVQRGRGQAGPIGDYAQVLLAEAASQLEVPAAGQALLEPLSATELAVLRLVAAGLSNDRIAAERVVGTNTIKWHLKNIYGKLGVRSRTAAVARARALRLFD